MELELACRVAKGPRETNDDRALVLQKICNNEEAFATAELPVAAVVCDGCGGYDGGGIAAATVLETLREKTPEELLDPAVLTQSLEQAESRIAERKKEYPDYHHMCTTVVGCVFGEDRTLIFHSGDSRAYRFDGSFLARLTIDHSAVQALVDAGRITEEEALIHPQRNVILRCMGVGGLPPEIYLSHAAIRPGEIFILCSDGLWEYVSGDRIVGILQEAPDLPAAAARLVDAALDNGGDDNTTVLLCACRGGGAPEPENTADPQFTLD